MDIVVASAHKITVSSAISCFNGSHQCLGLLPLKVAVLDKGERLVSIISANTACGRHHVTVSLKKLLNCGRHVWFRPVQSSKHRHKSDRLRHVGMIDLIKSLHDLLSYFRPPWVRSSCWWREL